VRRVRVHVGREGDTGRGSFGMFVGTMESQADGEVRGFRPGACLP
jgi:hypothetical protein